MSYKLEKPFTDIQLKDIKGYEGLYKIDKDCNVYRFFKNSYNKLTPRETTWGYYNFSLTKNGQSKNYYAHRLIAQAFIPNPGNKPYINHIDGNKQNNKIENLEWCTAKENNLHKYDVLGYKKPLLTNEQKHSLSIVHLGKNTGKDNGKSVKVQCNETGKIYDCIRDCAKDINGTPQGIRDVLNGKYHKHRKLTFNYYKEVA